MRKVAVRLWGAGAIDRAIAILAFIWSSVSYEVGQAFQPDAGRLGHENVGLESLPSQIRPRLYLVVWRCRLLDFFLQNRSSARLIPGQKDTLRAETPRT